MNKIKKYRKWEKCFSFALHRVLCISPFYTRYIKHVNFENFRENDYESKVVEKHNVPKAEINK